MRTFSAILIFMVVLSSVVFCGSKGPSPDELAAQEAIAEQARKDSLEYEMKKALSLGLEYYKNSQYRDAIPYFRRIIEELDPEEERGWKYLADSYLRLGHPDSAEAVYTEGLTKFPEAGYLHRGLALIYQQRAADNPDKQQEFLDNALSRYITASSLDSTDSFSPSQIARIYLARAKLDSAITWFDYSCCVDSNSVENWERLSELYMVRGNWEGVRKSYGNLHRIDPNNSIYILNLGRALANTGDYENAVVTLDKYIEANPEDAKGYQYMGLVHAANKKYTDAVAVFAEAERREPDNITLLLDMSNTYVDMNQYGNANKYLSKARRIDPNSCEAIVVEGNICVGRVRVEVPEEGIGIRDKLKFECCYEIYRKARRADCEKWATVAKMKMDYIKQYLPTEQEKNEFFFIHPELKGKMCE